MSYTQQFRQNRSVLRHCISSTLYIVSCNIWTIDDASLTLQRFKYILSLLLAEEFNPVFNCKYTTNCSHMVKNQPKTSRHQCQELHYDFKDYNLAYGPKIKSIPDMWHRMEAQDSFGITWHFYSNSKHRIHA
jgi:hypothetical protein